MSTAPAAGPRGSVSQRAVAQVCRALARGVAAGANAPTTAGLRCPRVWRRLETSRCVERPLVRTASMVRRAAPQRQGGRLAVEADGRAGGSVARGRTTSQFLTRAV